VIGDENADAAALEVFDEVANIADRQWVDARKWLVEQHDRWLCRERTGNFTSAALAARKRHRCRAAQLGKAKFLE